MQHLPDLSVILPKLIRILFKSLLELLLYLVVHQVSQRAPFGNFSEQVLTGAALKVGPCVVVFWRVVHDWVVLLLRWPVLFLKVMVDRGWAFESDSDLILIRAFLGFFCVHLLVWLNLIPWLLEQVEFFERGSFGQRTLVSIKVLTLRQPLVAHYSFRVFSESELFVLTSLRKALLSRRLESRRCSGESKFPLLVFNSWGLYAVLVDCVVVYDNSAETWFWVTQPWVLEVFCVSRSWSYPCSCCLRPF